MSRRAAACDHAQAKFVHFRQVTTGLKAPLLLHGHLIADTAYLSQTCTSLLY